MIAKTIGYARTASSEQDIDAQVEMLRAAGCSVVYTDRAMSGCSHQNPGLTQARADLAPDDTLKVVRLDRISRSTSAVMTFVTDLNRNGIALDAVDEADIARSVLSD